MASIDFFPGNGAFKPPSATFDITGVTAKRVGAFPNYYAFDTDGTMFVLHVQGVAGPGGVAALSATTGKVLAFVPAGSIFSGSVNTGSIAITPANSYAVVENSTFPDAPERGTIALISTRSFKVAGRVPVGIEPIGLAIDPVTSTAYVPNYAVDTMSYFAVPR